MNSLLRHQRIVFNALCLGIAVFLLWRILHILPLYKNSEQRETIRTALTHVAEREGWLLSNISIEEVTSDHLKLIVRNHHRGPDAEICTTVNLSDSSLHPCE